MLAFSRFTRYFIEVSKHGSIRKAAEAIHVSPSAIDRQLLTAEEALGVPLFERLPGGLRLTAAGELLLASVRNWTKDYERMTHQIDDLVGFRRGHVRLAVVDALSKGFIPRAITAMRREYPGITFDITVLDNVNIGGAIDRGEVDFGLVINPQSTRDLTVRSFIDIGLGFVATKGHPLNALAQTRFSTCLDYPIVAPTEPLALCEQVKALSAATGITLKPVTSSDNIQMIKSLVIEGAGVGVLTSLDVMEEVRAGLLSFTRISDPVVRPMVLAVCINRARQLSQAARLSLDHIERQLRQAETIQNHALASAES